jgi:hypothetical protein
MADDKKEQQIDLKQWIKLHGSGFVVKVRNGKPYLSKKPNRNPARRKSAGEQRQVNLFKLAVKHAQDAREDPELSEKYRAIAERESRSAYHVAISEFLKQHREESPSGKLEFEDILVEKTGSHLFLKVLFESALPLKKMDVWLLELDKTLVEQGRAEQATVTAWWYLIQNPDIAGLPFRAVIKATDAEGNVFEGERVIV